MKRGTAAIAVGIGLALTAMVGPALGGQPKTHDGFFLRLSGGLGGATTKLESGGENAKLSGGSADFNIALGAVVTPNLALHGTFFGWSEGANIDGNFGSMGAFGGGVTYYFMPANIYVSGSLGSGRLSVNTPLVSGDSDRGLAGELSLGKEWWLGKSWGLGVAGAYGFHSIPDGGVDENWKGHDFAARLTATLN